MSALALYKNMCELSAQMVVAARDNDWELLTGLEHQVAGLRDRLAVNDEDGSVTEPLNAHQREQKIGMIRQILADDAEVRRHTEPWMQNVQQFLGSQRQNRRVQQAYGALSSFR